MNMSLNHKVRHGHDPTKIRQVKHENYSEHIHWRKQEYTVCKGQSKSVVPKVDDIAPGGDFKCQGMGRKYVI